MAYFRNIVTVMATILVITVFALGCAQFMVEEDDVIDSQDKQYVTVKRYDNVIAIRKGKPIVIRDSTYVKFKQRHILAEGEIIYQAHYSNDGKEHYFILKNKKNKHISSPQNLDCDLIEWCGRHHGEYIKFAKQYYPKERYIIITKDNEIIY